MKDEGIAAVYGVMVYMYNSGYNKGRADSSVSTGLPISKDEMFVAHFEEVSTLLAKLQKGEE